MAFYFVFAIILIAFFLLLKRHSKIRPALPPGPPANPLFGHFFKIPATHQETTFYHWGKLYGDVIHLHALGRSWIVLNSVQAAVDLLEKRSHNYSDRPYLPILEIMGWVPSLSLLKYGKRFQLHRKMMTQHLNKNKCVLYQPSQTREARVLVQNLVANSEGCDGYITRFSTAIIMRIAFGHRVDSDDDKYLQIAEDAGHALANAGSPGGTPVDFFPFLQKLPSWFPGAYWASYARKHNPAVRKLHEYPFSVVQEQMAKGQANSSFLASQLDILSRDGAHRQGTIQDIQGVAGTMYIAGADTTGITLSIFVLAMILYPECQIRAQKEIDTVLGPRRFPEFSDRDSLPYIECVLQETFRWNHAAPLGVPHRSLEDDIYKGMFIPRGSIVIANTRGMTLDESMYADPSEFNPSRFLPKPLGNGEPYPNSQFGFGRRICPGRHLADANVWIAIASILATVTILKAMGSDGEEITPEVKFTAGITSRPYPYRCNIRPRNKAAEALIAQADTLDYY